MLDGTLSVRRRDPKPSESSADVKQAAIAGGAFEYFADMEAIFGRGHVKSKDLAPIVGPADEFRVETRRTARLKEFDRFLKAFKYTAALDAGMKKVSSCPSILTKDCATDNDFCIDSGTSPQRCSSSRAVWTR
jgi:U3 small nucleolar RNA-associated protein 15